MNICKTYFFSFSVISWKILQLQWYYICWIQTSVSLGIKDTVVFQIRKKRSFELSIFFFIFRIIIIISRTTASDCQKNWLRSFLSKLCKFLCSCKNSCLIHMHLKHMLSLLTFTLSFYHLILIVNFAVFNRRNIRKIITFKSN